MKSFRRNIQKFLYGEELFKRKPLPPRRWAAELYELLIEYNLSIKNYDTNGFTEKLTIAWATPAARLRRLRSKITWGPYGIFANCYKSREAFIAAVKVDFGTWLVAAGLVGCFVWPDWWWLSLIVAFVGLVIILWFYPQIDFWDVSYEIWVNPETWPDRFNQHTRELTAPTLPPAIQNALELKVLPADAFAYCAHPDPRWVMYSSAFHSNPEWLYLQRRRKLHLIAQTLTEFVPVAGVKAEVYFPTIREEEFDFWSGLADILLLNEGRSPNGQCEFFFSFAALAPRTRQSRSLYPGVWGPFNLIKWPYSNLGSLLRELLGVFYCWLGALSFWILIFSVKAGVSNLIWYACFLTCFIGSLVGLIIIKRNIENWGAHELLELIPPAYPRNHPGERKRYKLFIKTAKRPWLLLNFFLYWWVITLLI